MEELEKSMYFRGKPGTLEVTGILRKYMTYYETMLYKIY
jgi:hypothetical protein